jgi:hypothetical protein
MPDNEALEQELNSFRPVSRMDALRQLAAQAGACPAAPSANHNLHIHSFFSYNALGWSPARIAWESRKTGLYAAGLCDFDVIDGLEEFLSAGLLLGLRTAVHVETRAFLKEYADREINSPGEPGVTYIMGSGFFRMPPPNSPQAVTLAGLREQARSRNMALVGRINRRIPEIALDYDMDVAPLTPAGAATERHIITAYIHKATRTLRDPMACVAFWANLLGRAPEDMQRIMADTPAFEEVVRAKLAKQGGLGYEQPSADAFPLADDFLAWVAACGAIPMVAWLDGASAGEKDARALLECLAAKGAAALNIIPDRNWNLKDPAARGRKIACLHAIVEEAERLHMPVNIGTEMNKLGQPWTDDLAAEALKPHAAAFLRGARVMVGHTLLARYAGMPYAGDAARDEFSDVVQRNTFFEKVGALEPMTAEQAARLQLLGEKRAFAWFRDAVR